MTGGMGGGPRRGGVAAVPRALAISDGKVDGNNISFTVKVDFNGNTMVSKYEGTLSGDELKLKVNREGRNGATTSELTAKRSTT
jgi:hypothetical protein